MHDDSTIGNTGWIMMFSHRHNQKLAPWFHVERTSPDGQLKLPHLWSRKFPHPVRQD